MSVLGDGLRRVRRKLQQSRRRLFHRISEAQINTALGELCAARADLLMVHSSLSSCGHVIPGPQGIIRALRRHCETLCLPTHTYCYPINGVTPTYDPRATPSVVGTITNVFWQSAGVSRSVHPTHSLAGIGPLADELCRGHHLCETACGKGSPYEKLIQKDAAVLMFGVTMNSYTLFHCAEDAEKCSYLYEPEPYQLMATDFDGNLHRIKLWRQDMSVARRFTAMRDELRDQGLLRILPFGLNELLYIPSSKQVHDYTTAKLRENEYHLVAGQTNPADRICKSGTTNRKESHVTD